MDKEFAALPGPQKKNSMATLSLISGIVGWALALILLCVNVIIFGLALVSGGVASVLYICTAAVGCITPLAWLLAIITGHVAQSQIKQSGEDGKGSATAGLIMGYVGLGLLLLSICLIVILPLMGVGLSIPFLEDILYELGIY